jgi:hypothetical protein
MPQGDVGDAWHYRHLSVKIHTYTTIHLQLLTHSVKIRTLTFEISTILWKNTENTATTHSAKISMMTGVHRTVTDPVKVFDSEARWSKKKTRLSSLETVHLVLTGFMSVLRR